MIVELSQVRDLMLVNQEHPISWNPQSLVLVGGRVLMDERAACALNRLMEELDGWNFITAVSGWRSQEEQHEKNAVLSIGYADGIPRALSCGKGRVLIAGLEAPIIGLICMDQLLVDVTDIPDAAAGDTAVLIGTSDSRQITACDLAEQTGTITNEILSRLSIRLNRLMV